MVSVPGTRIFSACQPPRTRNRHKRARWTSRSGAEEWPASRRSAATCRPHAVLLRWLPVHIVLIRFRLRMRILRLPRIVVAIRFCLCGVGHDASIREPACAGPRAAMPGDRLRQSRRAIRSPLPAAHSRTDHVLGVIHSTAASQDSETTHASRRQFSIGRPIVPPRRMIDPLTILPRHGRPTGEEQRQGLTRPCPQHGAAARQASDSCNATSLWPAIGVRYWLAKIIPTGQMIDSSALLSRHGPRRRAIHDFADAS